jgi:predicted nucleotidyltransferase
MKLASGIPARKLPPRQTRLRRPTRNTLALSSEVQDFMRQFREWRDSFHNPSQRRVYIQRVCDRIAERYHPEKIILFGSHAWGQPMPESDLDLLVVMNFAGSPVRQAIAISRELGLVTPMDLLIRTPEQLQHHLEIGDSFMQEIVTRGKVMYEARHS